MVIDAAMFVVPATEVSTVRTPGFDPLLHIAEVTSPRSGSPRATTAGPIRRPPGASPSPASP
ncbi:hypothetical protein [Streptomyces sp. NPDC005799]|uniref:hypothetical protein n=1 Tax=Streptomyces sp. NPDC005799 TaxID=3154678 RepID=UPI0033C94B8F